MSSDNVDHRPAGTLYLHGNRVCFEHACVCDNVYVNDMCVRVHVNMFTCVWPFCALCIVVISFKDV